METCRQHGEITVKANYEISNRHARFSRREYIHWRLYESVGKKRNKRVRLLFLSTLLISSWVASFLEWYRNYWFLFLAISRLFFLFFLATLYSSRNNKEERVLLYLHQHFSSRALWALCAQNPHARWKLFGFLLFACSSSIRVSPLDPI